MEGKTTLTELETTLSIDDVADIGDALDLWHAAEAAARGRA